jgi:flagellar hook protein FlgE
MPLTSFYTALTGLNNNSLSINVIGDNLANMNTTAFKSSKANFSELLAGLSGTSATGNPVSFGLGSTLNGITRMNTQGTVTYTGNATDAAINGNGFFVVSIDGDQGITGFTRAGKFEFNNQGNLISSDGYSVMGYMAVNGKIDNGGAIAPITVKKGQSIPARATTNISMTANLDAQAADATTYSSSIQIYDSLGTAHTLSMTFTKTGIGAWSWSATIPATDTGGASTDAPVEVGTGTLGFDETGKLSDPAANPTISIAGLANGSADMDMEFMLWDDSGNAYITNYAGTSTVSSTTQDGTTASMLKGISIDSRGVVVGLSDNGQSIPVAQLAIAGFPNVDGLQKYNGSTFVAFTSSGDPSIGIAGIGGRGTIVGSSLEQSNVDMATEFVNLIVAQRSYQANSRVITTTDELYQDSLNLKR